MNGRIELQVEIEGRPEPVLVIADQRDLARWDVQPFCNDERVILRLRFLAWSAMFRQQMYANPFDRFNEEDCVYVGAPDDDDESEDEQGLDPGQPGATAAP